MAKINGRLWILKDSTNLIGATKSASLSLSADLPDTTTKDSAGWAEHLNNGLKEWNVDFDGLVDMSETIDVFDLSKKIISGTSVSLYFQPATLVHQDQYFYGNASLASLNVEAPNESPMTFSGSLKGNGVLRIGLYSTSA